jgi:hypothetical protein
MASWLTTFYQPTAPISDERIAITGGASQNLACLLQSFTDPVYTRNVWIVAPAYMLAFRIFDDSALKLRAVPEDEQGIDIEYLRSEIRKSEDRAPAQSSGEEVSCEAPAHPQSQCSTPMLDSRCQHRTNGHTAPTGLNAIGCRFSVSPIAGIRYQFVRCFAFPTCSTHIVVPF